MAVSGCTIQSFSPICELRLLSLAKTRLLPNRNVCSFQENQRPAGNGGVSCSSFSLVREACACEQPIFRGRQTLQLTVTSFTIHTTQRGLASSTWAGKLPRLRSEEHTSELQS